jgi:NitT/TauT family transport system substrate-binding protein
MKKSVFYLGLMILLMILVIPLSGYTAEKVTKVIGGVTMSNETLFPYHLALKNGYFEKEGLTVELKTFINGPSVMMSMANGELDICVGIGFPPMLQAAAQGVDSKILLSMMKGSAPVVAGAHIKTFKDLDGKVVGTPGLGTTQNTLLSINAKEYGIKFKKILHGKITDLPVFLEKGEIDAFTSWEWVAAETVYRVKGAHYVLKWPVIKNSECIAMGAYGKFYNQNPDLVKKFMRAYLRGVKFYIENKKDMPAILGKMFNQREEVVRMAMENDVVEAPDINIPAVKLMAEDAIEAGRIKKEAVPDIDAFLKKYIDQSFLKELKEEVGLK